MGWTSGIAFLGVAVAVGATAAPRWSTSYYLGTVNPQALYDLGCSLGSRDLALPGAQDSVVVLNFGQPWQRNGERGTVLPGSLAFATLRQIQVASQWFGAGYWACTGSDTSSQLRLAIGTNNFCRPDANPCHVTRAHGEAWARTVNAVADWLGSRGYTSQVAVAGASDMEVLWNPPPVTRAWVDGYDSSNHWSLYDYGDAAGCPPAGSCSNGWTQEDLWYVTWGAPPSYPLPQIYATSGINARQWAALSLYAVKKHGTRIHVLGSFTQHQACTGPPARLCPGTANTPEEGWSQLDYELNRDSRTAQPVRWSTDIRWQ